MAKKTARGKGYRKHVSKKPYLSKRDIIVLCAALVVIAIGAIALFSYDDGALKVKDGSVVTEGDNWLIVDGSNARGRSRYFKLGEMGEIEGYSRETTPLAVDANIPEYIFTPEAEDTGITNVTVATSHSSAETLANYATATLGGLSGNTVGEVQTGEVDGRTFTWFTYTAEYYVSEEEAPVEEAPAEVEAAAEEEASAEEEAPAEEGEASDEPAPNRFEKAISGYIDAGHDSCVVLHVETRADSADGYLSDDALLTVLEQAISAVTLEGDAR
ncbi:MAG: hypothetical protein Q4C10_10705 [Clostridia bacterium]|nr:hypothetical protein [Clostridia bacterium]